MDPEWLSGALHGSPEILAIGTGTATVLAFFLGLSSEPEFIVLSGEALTPTFSIFLPVARSSSNIPGVNPTCYIIYI